MRIARSSGAPADKIKKRTAGDGPHPPQRTATCTRVVLTHAGEWRLDLDRQRPTATLPPPQASRTTSIAWWNLPTGPAGKHARVPRPSNGSASPSPGCLASPSSPPSSRGRSAGDPGLAAEQPAGPCRRRDEATMRAASSSALQPESSICSITARAVRVVTLSDGSDF